MLARWPDLLGMTRLKCRILSFLVSVAADYSEVEILNQIREDRDKVGMTRQKVERRELTERRHQLFAAVWLASVRSRFSIFTSNFPRL